MEDSYSIGTRNLNAKMSVRCTPFCSPCDKGYKHHELLVALLNTRDDCVGFSDDADHEVLQHAIKKYKNKGWDINTEIQEENEEFRFPLLHWACVLGKIRTVRWLLDNGLSSNDFNIHVLELFCFGQITYVLYTRKPHRKTSL